MVRRETIKEVSRAIAEHLGKPDNLAALEWCRKKKLSYENWLQVAILNALTDARLHPDHLEMWTDAPCMLTKPYKPTVEDRRKWCDWVLHAIKEQEYLWVELKTFSKRDAVSKRFNDIEVDMASLDLFHLNDTFDRWKHYSGMHEKELRERAESLLDSTHRGVCILSGITDFLKNKVLPHRPMWGSPARYEISEPFALWVWDRVLGKVL